MKILQNIGSLVWEQLCYCGPLSYNQESLGLQTLGSVIAVWGPLSLFEVIVRSRKSYLYFADFAVRYRMVRSVIAWWGPLSLFEVRYRTTKQVLRVFCRLCGPLSHDEVRYRLVRSVIAWWGPSSLGEVRYRLVRSVIVYGKKFATS